MPPFAPHGRTFSDGAMPHEPPLLAAHGVSKTYDGPGGAVHALLPTCLAIAKGEFVSLLGPSGCGKSTLLLLLAGLEQPTTGLVEICGRPIRGPGPDRGMVFQNYSLFPWLTVEDNIHFCFRLAVQEDYMRPVADVLRVRAQASRLLDITGLRPFARHYPSQLSGGMRQRVAIARALAAQPQVLLMDEPFGALDSLTRLEMQNLLAVIRHLQGSTIVFVTHDIEEAIFLSDRILLFSPRPGRILREIVVPLGSERDPDWRFQPDFLALKRELAAELSQIKPGALSRSDVLRILHPDHQQTQKP